MNITDRQTEYVSRMDDLLKKQGFRVKSDLRNEKIGFKIREHTIARVPYLLVVGDKEVTDGTVAVRTRTGKDLGSMPVEAFIQKLYQDVARYGRSALEE